MHDLSKKESPNMNRKLIILLLGSGNYAKKKELNMYYLSKKKVLIWTENWTFYYWTQVIMQKKELNMYLFVREIIIPRFALMALIMGH